ncbi:8521_t:CDS:2 [Paraglomus occultum]|uniref:8521_t:CDS:1 n=1 Tax=Paraglomus occultum TaxID=144539 RepID=A0A9N8WFN0_9GLOM|nr:8521_t:CDS:2 [Paraglomus occultum]
MNLSKPSSSSSASDAPGLLYAGFNQNFGCFAVGLEHGFRIYNCDPTKEKLRKEEGGGIAIVEMLFRCNYLALVGGGKNPKYAPNKVIIWDDYKEKPIVEMEFRNEVKNVKLKKDRIVVVLQNKVFVYRFDAMPEKLHTFETIDNDKGLVALSSSHSHAILATPGRQKGHIQIIDLNTTHPITVSGNTNGTTSTSIGQHRRSFSDHRSEETTKVRGQRTGSTTFMSTSISFIPAHTNKLSCLALNEDGSKCASASEKGTLIRVFDTASGKLLNELRRGLERAEIFSIAFSQDSKRLCVSSDKGTVHVFNLYADMEKGPGPVDNGKAYYGEVVVNYASVEWKSAVETYFPNTSRPSGHLLTSRLIVDAFVVLVRKAIASLLSVQMASATNTSLMKEEEVNVLGWKLRIFSRIKKTNVVRQDA